MIDVKRWVPKFLAGSLLAAGAVVMGWAGAGCGSRESTLQIRKEVGTPAVVSQADYRAAIESWRVHDPRYVLVNLIDPETARKRLVCIEAGDFLQAILIEEGLPQSPEGRDRAEKLALKQKNRTFRLANPDALKMASPRYSEETLAEVRDRVRGMTTEEIIKGISDQESALYRFCSGRNPDLSSIGHLLMERGVPCGRSCKPGLLAIYGQAPAKDKTSPPGR